MEVHLKPDQEAFIQHRVRAGAYATPDEVVQAAVDLLEEQTYTVNLPVTGADLVAVMQASPHKEIELKPSRPYMQVRDLSF